MKLGRAAGGVGRPEVPLSCWLATSIHPWESLRSHPPTAALPGLLLPARLSYLYFVIEYNTSLGLGFSVFLGVLFGHCFFFFHFLKTSK